MPARFYRHTTKEVGQKTHKMQIALAQLNYTVGDLDNNTKKTIEQIEKAAAKGADLVVFSELSVSGYPPRDFLEYETYIAACHTHLLRIAQACTHTAAIVGTPLRNPSRQGKRLLNTAVLLHQGRIEAVVAKTLLPDYDIFDEYRYFEPDTQATCINFKGHKIALTICEDLWSIGDDSLYTRPPMEVLALEQPDLIINIAASPFHKEQAATRQQILAQNASTYHLPLIYVNQVGGHTDLLFDGGSLVMNAKGELIKEMAYFEEDSCLIDIHTLHTAPSITATPNSPIALIHKALVMGIRDYFHKLNFKTAVLGLSGGIDSAVCLALAAEALGAENTRALLMPSPYSSQHSIDDAKALAETLACPYDIVPINQAYHAINESMALLFEGLPFGLTEENIQARIRGLMLMAVSNKFGPILLNTSNKSEAAVGYGTLYGDMNGGLSVLGDLYKTEVFALAKYINRHGVVIPENTINKPPSAELRPDQKDSDSLPDYDTLDKILQLYIEAQQNAEAIIQAGFDAETVRFAIHRVNINEHKRHQTAPILRVSSKAFGIGRRMPIVAKYDFTKS